MAETHRIAVVDDVVAMRKLFEGILKDRYEVLPFASGRAFVDSGERVDVVLLDIEMPDLDGYETCRHLRAHGMDETAVLFVSGHDGEQDRLAAYEAGGDDFITKPIVADELRIKVDTAIARHVRLRELASQSSAAQQIAFSAMSSMGALGVILEFMRGAADVSDLDALARRLIGALESWGLRGAVRLKGVAGASEAFSNAELSPLQTSVMARLADMGRIFQMRSRAIVNFPHVTLLVENLPIDDDEALGRTRDNLAMLGETAETMVRGINAVSQQERQRRLARDALAELHERIGEAADRSALNRRLSEEQLDHLRQDVGALLRGFGLTQIQQAMIADEMERSTEEMLRRFDEATQIDMLFARLLGRLQLLGASTDD